MVAGTTCNPVIVAPEGRDSAAALEALDARDEVAAQRNELRRISHVKDRMDHRGSKFRGSLDEFRPFSWGHFWRSVNHELASASTVAGSQWSMRKNCSCELSLAKIGRRVQHSELWKKKSFTIVSPPFSNSQPETTGGVHAVSPRPSLTAMVRTKAPGWVP